MYSLPITALLNVNTTYPFAQLATPATSGIEIMGIRMLPRNSTSTAALGIYGNYRSAGASFPTFTTPRKLLQRDPASLLPASGTPSTNTAVGLATTLGTEVASTQRYWNFQQSYGLREGTCGPYYDPAASLGIMVEPSSFYCFQFTSIPPATVSFDGEIIFREVLTAGRDFNVLIGTDADPAVALNVASGVIPWFKITAPATTGLLLRSIHLFQTADTTTARALLGLRHYPTEPTDAGTSAAIVPVEANGPPALFTAKYDLDGFQTGGSPVAAWDYRSMIPFNLGGELNWPLSPADEPISIAPSKSVFFCNEISANKNGYFGRALVTETN